MNRKQKKIRSDVPLIVQQKYMLLLWAHVRCKVCNLKFVVQKWLEESAKLHRIYNDLVGERTEFKAEFQKNKVFRPLFFKLKILWELFLEF